MSCSEQTYVLLIQASRRLSQLNGVSKIIPNQDILINSLVLQEAKESSAIENIITTHDEIFLAQIEPAQITKNAKEVQDHAKALKIGFELIKQDRLLCNRYLLQIHAQLEHINNFII